MGWSVSFWLGAVLLGALGGAMVVRGLFGHRLIASRTRSCPRCRYDMTSHAGSMMLCPECGFGARDEADWYRGMRRPFFLAAGMCLLLLAFGIGTRPTARQTGYLAFLPMSVQVRIWPEWSLLWRELGSDTGRDWASLMTEVENLQGRSDRLPLTRAAYRECMRLLRKERQEKWVYERAGILLKALDLDRIGPGELDFVTDDDVRYMMGHLDVNVAETGVLLASRLAARSPEFIGALFDWKPQDYRVQINTVHLAYVADRRSGRRVFDGILGSSQARRVNLALEQILPLVWKNDEDYEYILFWLVNGPIETRIRIAETLEIGLMRNTIDASTMLLLQRSNDPSLVKYESLVLLMLDLMEELADDPAMRNRTGFMSRYGGAAIPLYAQRLDATDNAEVAVRLVRTLQAQGAGAKIAIPSIQRVQQNPKWPDSLRREAEAAVRFIQNPGNGIPSVGRRSG